MFDCFDLVCGTSVGAIITLAAFACRKNPAEVIDLFFNLAADAFDKPLIQKVVEVAAEAAKHIDHPATKYAPYVPKVTEGLLALAGKTKFSGDKLATLLKTNLSATLFSECKSPQVPSSLRSLFIPNFLF